MNRCNTALLEMQTFELMVSPLFNPCFPTIILHLDLSDLRTVFESGGLDHDYTWLILSTMEL